MCCKKNHHTLFIIERKLKGFGQCQKTTRLKQENPKQCTGFRPTANGTEPTDRLARRGKGRFLHRAGLNGRNTESNAAAPLPENLRGNGRRHAFPRFCRVPRARLFLGQAAVYDFQRVMQTPLRHSPFKFGGIRPRNQRRVA